MLQGALSVTLARIPCNAAVTTRPVAIALKIQPIAAALLKC